VTDDQLRAAIVALANRAPWRKVELGGGYFDRRVPSRRRRGYYLPALEDLGNGECGAFTKARAEALCTLLNGLPRLLDLLGCHEATPPDTSGPEWPVSGAPDSEGQGSR
jgi:hypothetical protein